MNKLFELIFEKTPLLFALIVFVMIFAIAWVIDDFIVWFFFS